MISVDVVVELEHGTITVRVESAAELGAGLTLVCCAHYEDPVSVREEEIRRAIAGALGVAL